MEKIKGFMASLLLMGMAPFGQAAVTMRIQETDDVHITEAKTVARVAMQIIGHFKVETDMRDALFETFVLGDGRVGPISPPSFLRLADGYYSFAHSAVSFQFLDGSGYPVILENTSPHSRKEVGRLLEEVAAVRVQDSGEWKSNRYNAILESSEPGIPFTGDRLILSGSGQVRMPGGVVELNFKDLCMEDRILRGVVTGKARTFEFVLHLTNGIALGTIFTQDGNTVQIHLNESAEDIILAASR